MEETSSQTNDEAKNGKKVKSCRPIILLRRNSCSVTPSKKISGKTTQSPCANKNINQLLSLGDTIDVKPTEESILLSLANNSSNSKDSIPIVKTEIVENSMIAPWSVSAREMSVKKLNAPSICQSKIPMNFTNSDDKKKVRDALSIPGQMLPAPQKTFLQANSLIVPQPAPVNNVHPNLPIFTNPYQAVNQITVPVNDTALNPRMHFCSNEQFSNPANFRSGRYFYSPVVQSSVNHLVMPMQENKGQIFFHPSQSHSFSSEGAMLQTYPSPTCHVQNPPLQPDTCHPGSASHGQLDSIADDSLTNITWLGKMGVNNFMPVPLEKEKKLERNDKRGRPPYSYMALIQFAINSSATGRMTLRQIYEWIEEKFPYFRTAKPGWKNSIRHNLSLHDLFVREVSNGSKASYWTLRPDLNVRPLTLDSVGSSPSQGPVWSLQSVGQNQKPILPRLPYCSRPYILLPVPLLQSSKDSNLNNAQKNHSTECSDSTNQDVSASSSLFVDSGLHSDISYCTPSVTSKNFSLFSDSAVNLHSDSENVLLKSDKNSEDSCPFLSQANSNEKSTKRSRKEPLKTLNDSLNSSFQFDKEDLISPPHHQRQFLKKDDGDSARPMTVGLSEESFTELLNDLGSPFKSYLTQESNRNKVSSPKGDHARKRRRSWGSPESSGCGFAFQRKLKAANEQTPRQNMRRVKSDFIDLTKEDSLLPTSTPLLKEKWKKPSYQKSKTWKNFENKENVTPTKSFPSNETSWRSGTITHTKNPVLAPSPILNPQVDADFEKNFFEDIIGSVFKTPEKPSAPVRHFDSLTPTRPPFSAPTPSHCSLASANKSDDESMPMLLGASPSKEEPLNTSFSKLLDISGSSSRLPGTFPELDLNLSWSNMSNL